MLRYTGRLFHSTELTNAKVYVQEIIDTLHHFGVFNYVVLVGVFLLVGLKPVPLPLMLELNHLVCTFLNFPHQTI